jgi:predicted anti-sigma-YlaC factor YlaD
VTTPPPVPPAEAYPGDAAHRVMCRQVVELLTGYLEGALGEPLQAEVDTHLAACPDCLVFLEQLRTTLGLLGALPTPDQLPGPTVDLLVRAFLDLTVR